MEKQVQKAKHLPNKYIYGAFLITTILFIVLKDFSMAVIFGGIGLAFDPFDQSVSFNKRPQWQKVWLIAHIILVMIIIVMAIIK